MLNMRLEIGFHDVFAFPIQRVRRYPEDANEAAEEAADGVEERAEGDEPAAPAKTATGFFGRLFGGGGGVTATAAAAAAEKPEEAAEEEPEKLGDTSADADTDAGARAGAGGDGDDGGGDSDSDGGSDGNGGEEAAGKEEEEAKEDDDKSGKKPRKNGKLRPKARDVKNIVLIGNGRSVLKKKLGAKVDEFDLVGRFNFFKLGKFEQNVGSRTDLWFIGELRQPGPVGHRASTTVSIPIFTPYV